ncbi:MAG TPA: hypothetical protein VNN10_04225 [Dehalococcoidia bacterium]|nr:hypothetical protein [Dehalococcoidia bacterium]
MDPSVIRILFGCTYGASREESAMRASLGRLTPAKLRSPVTHRSAGTPDLEADASWRSESWT